MANVKDVISILCKHLNCLVHVNLKPEHFRRSKFDQVEENTVSQLWQVLYKVLKQIKSVNLIFNDNNPVVEFVKSYFTLLQYDSIEFYCLPSDMSHGSRELLLALAWLMITENILERVMLQHLKKSHLRKEFLDTTSMTKQNSESEIRKIQSPMPFDEEINYIMWAAGKIRHNSNAISEEDRVRVQLMTQIHLGSVDTCGLPHLSVSETNLVQQPQLLARQLALVELDVQLMDIHRQWTAKSHVFWEWMESVVAEKQKSSQSHRLNINQKNNLIQEIDSLRSQLKTCITVFERTDYCRTGDFKLSNKSVNEHNGMPRYILTSKDGETEVEKWLPETEVLVDILKEESDRKEAHVREELCKLSNRMENIHVVI